MLARLRMLWVNVRDSLWFLPATFTLAAALLALGLIGLEAREWEAAQAAGEWLWSGGPEGTRGVLSAIASSLITVTGVVFSVTIVALQLASSQFTPRLLRNFTADRSNQTVLAVLIGTFTYALLVLRAVRSEAQGGEEFVPRIAAMGALVLVLVSIGFLIYFIDHAARSIQLAVILDRVTRQTREGIQRMLPDRDRGVRERIHATWSPPAGAPATISADASGYLQVVDEEALARLCASCDTWMRMEPRIGEFVLRGRSLVSVWPATACDEEIEKQVRRAFVLGHEPTPEQDLSFGIIEISDIAVKALSPSVNDPTTALRCIDRLGDILLEIGQRAEGPPPAPLEGPPRFLPRPLDYERMVGMAFGQIRHYGAPNAIIGRKLVDLLAQLRELLPPERRAPIEAQLEAAITDARRAVASPIELTGFERMLVRKGLSGEPTEVNSAG